MCIQVFYWLQEKWPPLDRTIRHHSIPPPPGPRLTMLTPSLHSSYTDYILSTKHQPILRSSDKKSSAMFCLFESYVRGNVIGITFDKGYANKDDIYAWPMPFTVLIKLFYTRNKSFKCKVSFKKIRKHVITLNFCFQVLVGLKFCRACNAQFYGRI